MSSDPQDATAGPEPEDDTGELPPLLSPGDVLAGRYRIHDVTHGPEGLVYRAEDLQRCANCGSAGATPDDRYCRACGAALDRHPQCTLRLLGGAAARPPRAESGEVLEVQGLTFLVLPVGPDAQRDRPLAALRLTTGLATDAGRVRQRDEDSLLAMQLAAFHLGRLETSQGLFAIADGVGGLAHGAIASRLALHHLARTLGTRVMLEDPEALSLPGRRLLTMLAEAIQDANSFLYDQQQQSGGARTMGTTVTAAYVCGAFAAVANVGDSRTYLWHGAHLQQLTQDHSMVAGLVRAGLAQPEDVYTHPQKSVITRSLGNGPSVEVDTFLCELAAGDRLVLCCDGVWEMVHDEELAGVLREEPDPQAAATRIIALANQNGGQDNLSVIVVAVEALGE